VLIEVKGQAHIGKFALLLHNITPPTKYTKIYANDFVYNQGKCSSA